MNATGFISHSPVIVFYIGMGFVGGYVLHIWVHRKAILL